MWDRAIQLSIQLVTDALLHREVLPREALAFEKISGALTVRTALRSRSAPQALLFLLPEATATTARYITASLLIGDHGHLNGATQLPPNEVLRLVRGDVVLVTQAVSDSKELLEALPIGSYQRLADIWEVVSLSKYTTGRGNKPRVFVANPGWFLQVAPGRRFGAVIIDASHPRTFVQLVELVRAARGCTNLRVAVCPPPGDDVLAACGYPSEISVWGWDPQARTDAQNAVETKDGVIHQAGDRFFWECDSDPEAASALSELHKALASAARAAAGRPYPGLRQCWSIYNRLRQATVPLAELEQVAASTWTGNLRARIEELDDVQGYGTVAWDTTWPQLLEKTKAAYQTMLRRKESAKFWALASNIEQFLASPAEQLRIVVASEAELQLLVAAYESIIDGFVEAFARGRIEFITRSREARLIAEGQCCPTVLLGPRANRYRYLDVFASRRVDEFLYPHEVDAELGAQSRLYGTWMECLGDERRIGSLEPLGFNRIGDEEPRPPPSRPVVVVRKSSGHDVEVASMVSVSPQLDIESLIDVPSDGVGIGYTEGVSLTASDLIEVSFLRGSVQRFYAQQRVDVYFSESGLVQRYGAAELKPGWQVISFVDGRYDGLFQRLTDVVTARLQPKERIALELWRTVKESIFTQAKSSRDLHDRLVKRGLASSYSTFLTWFGDGDETVIAPQQFEEFEVLASEADVYKSSSAMLEAAFRAVQHQRGRNRTAGRKLREFLRAVVSGNGYEEALTSARKLDTALADVLAAVEVLEIASVHILQRSQSG
jgi:hypothetical protein